MSSINRRNRRFIAKRNPGPLLLAARTLERKLIAGFGVFAVLFIAILMAAFASPVTPSDTTQPQQIARAASPESIDPLARLNRRVPGQGNTALASLVNMEGYSPESNRLMLTGFGGGGQTQQTTVDYIYDGQHMVRTRQNGGTGATYLTGPRGPEYRRDDVTGQARWYLYDGLGSVVGEVDPSGNITSSRKFDVFGRLRGGNNPSGTSKHKFVGRLGHLSEDETGLIYMRARYFDPLTGRSVSQDPAKRGKNWFSYAGNNPINGVDFTGEVTGNVSEPGEAAKAEQEVEGEGGDVAFQVLKSVRNTIANLNNAKWYDSKGLVKAIQNLLGCSKDEAGAIIHAAKEYGLGGADNIGLDSAGGLWTKSGEFLGFIDEFL